MPHFFKNYYYFFIRNVWLRGTGEDLRMLGLVSYSVQVQLRRRQSPTKLKRGIPRILWLTTWFINSDGGNGVVFKGTPYHFYIFNRIVNNSNPAQRGKEEKNVENWKAISNGIFGTSRSEEALPLLSSWA